ncbi:hypothetical protein M3Y97_00000100 [Aphelenchoides bicaudatus]|nr:hypothetical protein M3Y97_00000100 [Aphelenchoides bicaudatus]
MDQREIVQLLEYQRLIESYEFAYSTYLYTVLLLSTILTTAVLYLFFYRESRLNKELYCIYLHAILSCYGVIVATCLWQLVILPPSIGGYACDMSPFAFLGTDGFFFALWIIWALSAHLGVAYTLGFFIQTYRLKLSEPIDFIRSLVQWFEESKNTKTFLNGSLFFHCLLTAIPLVNIRMNLFNIDEYPALVAMHKRHPSMVLITKNNIILNFSIAVCAVIVLVEILFCIKSNWVTFRSVQSTSDIVTSKTFQSQMHMYRLSSIQLLMNIVFYFIPVAITASQMLGFLDMKYLGTINICAMVILCPAQSLGCIDWIPEITIKTSRLIFRR